MRDSLLDAYERELKYFREASLDFAAAHPAIGQHLGLEADAAVDPFVERLIEGAAFLAARVQQRLDRSVDHFADHLLDQVLPSVNAPVPSTAIVRLDPGATVSTITTQVRLPRGSMLRLTSNAARSRPFFLKTAQAITLRPMTVGDWHWIDGAAALRSADLGSSLAKNSVAALRVDWHIAESVRAMPLDVSDLELYFDGVGQAPMAALASVCTQARRLVMVSVSGNSRRVVGSWRADEAMTLAALQPDSALLMEGETGLYAGFRLLQEYFVLPERFRLLSLRFGATQAPPSERIELYFVFDQAVPSLVADLERTRLTAYCVPVVNLYPRVLDRAALDTGGEARLVADRTRATDFEVVAVLGGHAYLAGQAKGVPLMPLYASGLIENDEDYRFSTRREIDRAPSNETSRTAGVYLPTESWLVLADAPDGTDAAPTHVAAQALVSNRERCYEVVRGAGGYTLALEDPVPVESVVFAVTPTPPESAGTAHVASWRLLGALRLNYFSLFGEEGKAGPEPWRALLALFSDPKNRFAGPVVAGVIGASVETAVARLPGSGPLSFARGADIVLDVDQALAESGQYFALGAILDVLLAGYASVNSFTRLTLRDARGHVLHRWPARAGVHECL